MCRNMVLRPSSRPGLGAHDKLVRAVGASARQRNKHTIELSGPLSRQGSLCRDRVPRHTRRFSLRQRLSLSR